jgi:hypothetical protein
MVANDMFRSVVQSGKSQKKFVRMTNLRSFRIKSVEVMCACDSASGNTATTPITWPCCEGLFAKRVAFEFKTPLRTWKEVENCTLLGYSATRRLQFSCLLHDRSLKSHVENSYLFVVCFPIIENISYYTYCFCCATKVCVCFQKCWEALVRCPVTPHHVSVMWNYDLRMRKVV